MRDADHDAVRDAEPPPEPPPKPPPKPPPEPGPDRDVRAELTDALRRAREAAATMDVDLTPAETAGVAGMMVLFERLDFLRGASLDVSRTGSTRAGPSRADRERMAVLPPKSGSGRS